MRGKELQEARLNLDILHQDKANQGADVRRGHRFTPTRVGKTWTNTRFTPTRVGKTMRPIMRHRGFQVHPHACGEDEQRFGV